MPSDRLFSSGTAYHRKRKSPEKIVFSLIRYHKKTYYTDACIYSPNVIVFKDDSYAANNYDGCEKSPKEQYYLNADGRDEGLKEIDEDSAEAFDNWLNNRERHGGHPWEICRGGNSTHIDLMVHRDDDGFFLYLRGSAWTRTIETVKFYLVLTREDIPVYLRDAHILSARLAETELIGIVPEGVMPAYCENWFPDEKIIDFINLPYEDTEQFVPYCHWQPIPKTSLLKT